MRASVRLLDRKSREQTDAIGGWGHVADAAVRTNIVVIVPPCRNQPPSVSEAFKYMFVQALVTDAPIQALGVSVFSGLARRDVMPFDTAFLRPCQNGAACKLRAIVADDAQGLAVTLNQPIKLPHNPCAANGCVRRER